MQPLNIFCLYIMLCIGCWHLNLELKYVCSVLCMFNFLYVLYQHKRARQFLGSRHKWSDPFFMMLSTPACHAPFTPAPQHNSSFSNMTAPRNGSYNVKPEVCNVLSFQGFVQYCLKHAVKMCNICTMFFSYYNCSF